MKYAASSPAGDENLRRFTERIRSSRALQKLNEVAQSLSGLFLVILVRIDDQMVELFPAGGEGGLPSFCRVFRETVLGQKRCLTCRSLVAFGACYRGLIEYACHGGVSVVAAPAVRRDGTRSERVVVASCAFAQQSHARGWPLAKEHAGHLGVDMKELKRAYFELPAATEEKQQFARGITDAAASLVGEFEDQLENEPEGRQVAGDGLDSFWTAIGLTRDRSYKQEGGSVGSVLVDQVIAMVKRDPSMPYHVSSIARAAHVTPNYFSALFSKHTGQTFRVFLSEQRVLYACDLLRDIRLTVADVAGRAGFHDPAYFSRRFKEVTGSAPTDWRTRTLEQGLDGARSE